MLVIKTLVLMFVMTFCFFEAHGKYTWSKSKRVNFPNIFGKRGPSVKKDETIVASEMITEGSDQHNTKTNDSLPPLGLGEDEEDIAEKNAKKLEKSKSLVQSIISRSSDLWNSFKDKAQRNKGHPWPKYKHSKTKSEYLTTTKPSSPNQHSDRGNSQDSSTGKAESDASSDQKHNTQNKDLLPTLDLNEDEEDIVETSTKTVEKSKSLLQNIISQSSQLMNSFKDKARKNQGELWPKYKQFKNKFKNKIRISDHN